MNLYIKSTDYLDAVAEEFLEKTAGQKQFAFYGNMGVGKTTFIKALCKKLGVTDPVTSPTFAIVNEYRTKRNEWVYHFDFYRINKPEDVFDFGCEEYFDSPYYCFIEWPEKAEIILPESICKVYITEEPDGSRFIRIL